MSNMGYGHGSLPGPQRHPRPPLCSSEASTSDYRTTARRTVTQKTPSNLGYGYGSYQGLGGILDLFRFFGGLSLLQPGLHYSPDVMDGEVVLKTKRTKLYTVYNAKLNKCFVTAE